MLCRYCGTTNPIDARFCCHCGMRIDRATIVLAPAPITSVLPSPGMLVGGIQPVSGTISMVDGASQVSAVPSAYGTPQISSMPPAQGGSPASPSSPISHGASPAQGASLSPPLARPQHPLPETRPLPTHQAEPSPHPAHHGDAHTADHLESPPRAQPQTGTRSHSTSLQSTMGRQAAAATGVTVAGQLSRRALLIALGGAATVAVGVGAVVYVNNATSTPEKTISNYLEAVKRRDGKTAYEQLSSRLQSQSNEQQFISGVNLVGGFIGSYTISNVQENGSTATATVSVTALIVTINYSVMLVKENGVWKLNGGTLINIH